MTSIENFQYQLVLPELIQLNQTQSKKSCVIIGTIDQNSILKSF